MKNTVSIKELTKRSAEESLLNTLMAQKSPTLPSVSELVEGTVLRIEPNAVYVDLGSAHTGVILGQEVKRYPRVFRNLEVGDSITAKVIALENEDGYTELSIKEAEEEKRWSRLRELEENGEVVETEILDANKGGLIVEISNVQGFMPVSQLAPEHYPRVEGGDKQKIYQALQEFVGDTLQMKVIDIDQGEEKLIVSERAAQKKKLEERVAQFDVGDVVEGTVTGVVDFGAFVKFDNLEGLVHISELDWQLIEDPHEIVSVGDTVKTKIIEIDGDRISLSMKALKDNPWDDIEEHYSEGDTIEGAVTKINPFGAFVQIDDKIQGLAHVSEFGSEEAMREQIREDETYPFTILNIEPEEYRMALGIHPEDEGATTNDAKEETGAEHKSSEQSDENDAKTDADENDGAINEESSEKDETEEQATKQKHTNKPNDETEEDGGEETDKESA